MPRAESIEAQRDFSLGEIDISAKRRDDISVLKNGARQMSNFRILNSGALENRPGRTARFLEAGRVEPINMAPGQRFNLAFGPGYIHVWNANAVMVFSTITKGDGVTHLPWTSPTLGQIVYDVYQNSIYITYGDDAPNNVPLVLSWDGVSQTSTWTLSNFGEYINGNQKRTAFYRISPPNITMQPSATTGSVTLTASAPVFSAGSVNTRIRWVGRQILITGVTDSTHATGTVEETLPNSETLNYSITGANAHFSLGDTVIGSVSGARGVVTAVTTTSITVVIINGIDFVWTGTTTSTDVPIGPGGNNGAINASPTIVSPQPIGIWDDEVMNFYRGWPRSVTVDQGRLVFCNFPSVPSGIAWSAFGNFTDFYIDFSTAAPDDAIFEIAPGKSQVYYVVPGMESSEFAFCDNAVYYIPITVQDPLKPGSVQFNALNASGCAQIQPRRAEQSIIYVSTGRAQIMAVQAPGAYYRPYVVDDISEIHGHLFLASPPVALAVPSVSVQFEERYLYILLANGNYVVGKFNIKNGLIEPGPEGKPHIGWVPCNGLGNITWIAGVGIDVIFTTLYALPGINAVSVVEGLDLTQVLDAAMPLHAAPPGLQPPGGLLSGPLWWLAGGTVFMWDNGRPLGNYQIDSFGNPVPQFYDGENLSSPTITGGLPWTSTLEPWVPQVPPGPGGAKQRMYLRKIKRTAVSVQSSTGFVLQRLQAEHTTPLMQSFGTPMSQIRFPYYEMGEDPVQPAPQREMTYWKRWLGRAYDPRIAIVKDTPGPLRIVEVGNEVTV